MSDKPGVAVHPPIAWALSLLAGAAADWLYPLHFVPVSVARGWIGAGVFAASVMLAVWAVATMRQAGTRVETHKPSTAIVVNGPYRFTRNPIYIGMFLAQTGLAIGLDDLWLLITLLPFYLVIRYGVVAREEAYLARKFGAAYLGYKSSVRRWL